MMSDSVTHAYILSHGSCSRDCSQLKANKAGPFHPQKWPLYIINFKQQQERYKNKQKCIINAKAVLPNIPQCLTLVMNALRVLLACCKNFNLSKTCVSNALGPPGYANGQPLGSDKIANVPPTGLTM